LPRFNLKKDLPIVALIMLLVLSYIAYNKADIKVLDLPTYEEFLEKDLFVSATVTDGEVILKSKDDTYSMIVDGIDFDKLLKKVPVSLSKESSFENSIFTIFAFLFFLLGVLLFNRFKKSSLAEVQKERSFADDSNFYKRATPMQKSDITFKDVAGVSEVKDELKEVIDFLKNPKKYQNFGIKLPRGVLLVGPPGVGKTMIAKAVAGEAKVPFFYQSGASFVHIYVGMGAKRVKDLFINAKRETPSIIFIDEIDAVGKARGNNNHNDEREATLNQLLVEMDGFEDSSSVIVIAATNQIEVLDEALLRSGRFDRRVFIPLPNIAERVEILKVHLKDKKHSLNLEEVAKMCVGFSGASLATLVNEAAIYALNRGAKKISLEDFEAVKDKVVLGKKKALAYSDSEREIQATYQAAKALSAYWYEVDFDKIGILGGELKGEDSEFSSRTKLLSKIKVYLSGKIATQIIYDESYSNATSDINKAKKIADDMTQKYAMGEGIIPTTLDSANILDEAILEVEGFLYKMKDSIKNIKDILLLDEYITKDRLKSIVDEVL
jgi:ATP-dependent metalloprotease FtsH